MKTTIQRIWFDRPIKAFRAESSCNVNRIDEKTFEVSPSVGLCHMAFSDGVHKHSAIFVGYERELSR